MKPRNTIKYTQSAHDDIQGILGTALSGVTQRTPAQYRTTGIVMNNIASGDVFSMVFQMPHQKKLDSLLDSVHIHYIPNASANGDIRFAYEWGRYEQEEVVPATLPNTGFCADITLATTDQYKLKVSNIIVGLTPPATESYSSILLVKLTASAPLDGTNRRTSGGTNTIALTYMDGHYIKDRTGSINEYSD